MTPKRYIQTWRIPKWLAASGLTIGKQSTSFQHCSNLSHKDSLRLHRQNKATRPATTKVNPIWVRFPTLQDSITRREMTKSTIEGAYSRGEQTTSLKPPFNPIIASLQTHKAKGPTQEASKQRHSSPLSTPSQNPQGKEHPLEHPFVPPEPIKKRKESLLRKRRKFKPPFQPPHTPNDRGENLHLNTLQGYRKSPFRFQYRSSPLTVENLVCLVRLCPFWQKGWVKVSTISRFYCRLIDFVHLTSNFFASLSQHDYN